MKNELTEMVFSERFRWIVRDIKTAAEILSGHQRGPIVVMPAALSTTKARLHRITKDIEDLNTTVENYLSHIREK